MNTIDTGAAAAPRSPLRMKTLTKTDNAPIRILVVDDEPDLALLIRQRFRKRVRASEFEFLFAENGAEALKLLGERSDIDIVLTDINMPVMDGLTLLAKLAQLDRLLKSVVVSAYGDMENIRTAMNRGAFDFLTKPIDFRDLEITLDKTISELDKLREGAQAKGRLIAVKRELDLASDLQMSILPREIPPTPGHAAFDIHACMVPAREVGGDFYDFFLLNDHLLGFVIGDVAGKGVPGAIYMAVSRTIIRATALTCVSPDCCLTHANNVLCCENSTDLFVTLVYGTLDLRTGEVVYTNAGHNPPYLLTSNGEARELENQGGLVLGVFDGFEYGSSSLTLQPGEALFLYTDGVTEAMRADHELFGADRLRSMLSPSNATSMARLTGAIREELDTFAEAHPQHDDITMLGLRYLGPA